jgi:hypothetical protein
MVTALMSNIKIQRPGACSAFLRSNQLPAGDLGVIRSPVKS